MIEIVSYDYSQRYKHETSEASPQEEKKIKTQWLKMLNFFPNTIVPTGKQFDRPLTSYLGVELNERNDWEI